MVAIFAGPGTGFERGSGSVLGGAGLLGNASIGRAGQQLFVNAETGNLMISQLDESLLGRGPDVGITRTYNSLGNFSDENGDNWRQSTDRRVYACTGSVNTAGSTVTRRSGDGSESLYIWNSTAGMYVSTDGGGAYDTLSYNSSTGIWTWTDGDSRLSETYSWFGSEWWVVSQTDKSGNSLAYYYQSGTSHIDRIVTSNGENIQYSWSGNNITDVVTHYTDLQANAAKTITRVHYDYDTSNRLSGVKVDLTPADGGDNVTFGLTYTYSDTTSKLIASISETGTSNLVSFTYVQVGSDYRIQSVTETGSGSGDRTTSFSYDTANRKTIVTDALGKARVFAYDAWGNLTSITDPADGTGAASGIVQFDYNANGDLLDSTDGLGRITRNSYDANGNLTQTVDPAGNTLRYEYDSKNQVVKKIRVVAGTGDAVTRYVYDSSERLRFEISSEGRVTEYGYYTSGNGVGLLAKTLQYTANSYDVSTLTSTANLDLAAMNTWTGGLGSSVAVQRTETTYDQRGNVTIVTQWVDGSATTQTLYTYDQSGLLLARTPAGSTGSEVYSYDGLGRVKSVTDLAGLATTTVYDDSNRKKTVTLSTNTLTRTSTYTAQGELASYVESGPDVASETESYFYDKLGRLRVSEDALGNHDFTFYDDAGRKTGYMDARGALIEYRYDAADRLVATIGWSNFLSTAAIGTLYDTNRNPTTATVASVRPAASNDDRWQWNIYDAADRVVQKIETVAGATTAPSGKVTTYSYDGYGNLVKTVESATVLSPAVIAGYIASPPGALNLINNAAMDSTIANWNEWGDTPISFQMPLTATTDAQGNHGVTTTFRTSSTATLAVTYCDFQDISAYAGRKFVISENIATGGAISNVQLIVDFWDQNGQWLQAFGVGAVSGQHATPVTVSGITNAAPAGAKYVRVLAWATASATNSDATLTVFKPEVSVAPAPQNLLANPSFDFGTQGWSQWGPAGVTFQSSPAITVDASGNRAITTSLQTNSTANYPSLFTDYQSTALAGNRYAVSMNVAVTGAIDHASLFADYYDANGQWLGNNYIGGITGAQPTAVTISAITAPAPANAATMRLSVVLAASAVNSNVTLTVSKPELVQVAPRQNLLPNPSFAQSTQDWTQSGSVSFQSTPATGPNSAGDPAISTSFTTTATGNPAYVYSDVYVGFPAAGVHFLASANIAVTGAVGHVDFFADFYSASGTWVGNSGTLAVITGAHATPVTVSGISTAAPANTAMIRFAAAIYASATNSNVTVSIAKPLLAVADEVVPLTSPNYSRAPAFAATPAANAQDRVTRYFYSSDGLMIGQLDTVGALTTYQYDSAGRAIRTTGYATLVTDATLRATGTYAQLVSAVGTSTADRTAYTAYDGEGRVKYKLDAYLRPTEYVYDAAGRVIKTIDYAGSINTQTDYSVANVASQISSLNLAANANVRTTRALYDNAGRLIYTVDAAGAVTAFGYNALGQQISLKRFATLYTSSNEPTALGLASWTTSSDDRTTLSFYDALGRLRYVQDAEGNVTEQQYDADDRLTRTIRWPGQQTFTTSSSVGSIALAFGPNPPATAAIERFAYDAAGNLVDQWDGDDNRTHYDRNAFGDAWQVTRAYGTGDAQVTSYTRDAGGRVVKMRTAFGTTQEAPTSYVYDGVGNLTDIYDANSQRTQRSYDALGRLVSETDALNNATTYQYDAFGGVTKVTDARLFSTYNYYDKLGRVTATRDAEDYVTETSYTVFGDVDHVTRRANRATNTAAVGTLPAVTADAKDATSWFQYDKLGRLTKTTDALTYYEQYTLNAFGQRSDVRNKLGGTTHYDYNRDGLVKLETGPTLVATQYSYDARGNLTRKVEAYGLPEARTTSYVYDNADRLAYAIDALGQVSAFTYDARGLQTKKVEFAPTYLSASQALADLNSWRDANIANAGNRVTRAFYDYNGQLAYSIDALGFVTRTERDAPGNVTKQTRYFDAYSATDGTSRAILDTAFATPPATARITQFAYDSAGRLTDTTDAEGWVTHLTFDALGQVLTSTRAYGTADARTTAYGYDKLGRLVTQTVQMGTSPSGSDLVTRYTYDAFGNRVQIRDPRGNDSLAWYDALGRVRLQSDGLHVTETVYTALGQIDSVIRHFGAITNTPTSTTPAVWAADARDATTSFHYDQLGRLTSTTDAAGFTESYGLDNFGQRSSVTNKLGGITTYSYDKLGRVLSETLPSSITTKNAGGTSIAVVNSYSYNSFGECIQKTEAVGAVEQRQTGYGYDKLGQVKSVTHDAAAYMNADLTTTDPATGPSETYAYNAFGEVTKSSDAADAATLYWYDRDGRVVARIVQTDMVAGTAKGTLTLTSYYGYGKTKTVTIYGDPVTVPSDTSSAPPSGTGNTRTTSNDYDYAGRLKTVTLSGTSGGVTGITSGEWNGTSWSSTTGAITIQANGYDATGNLVQQTDGRNNSTCFWYDVVGNKIAQIDAANYLTTWTRDAEGNVITETRYANAVTGTFTTATAASSLTGLLGSNAVDADRTTGFTYDKMGRRLSETRSGVDYVFIDGSGTITSGTTSSVIAYTYNGLGEVLTKTEANNDLTSYAYDAAGRLTLQTDQGYTDYQGNAVAPRTAYSYNGLNDLTSVRSQAAASANDTNDHITSYIYGTGGQMLSMTDAMGNTHNFAYDRAGRQVRESYSRILSDSTTSVTEAKVTRYDLAGRIVTQTLARLSGSTWVFTNAAGAYYDANRIRYDAFGTVTGRGITAGPDATAAYQESYEYDAAGRVWRSNSQDGVYRLHIYDKAGNETLTIASTGADLSTASFTATNLDGFVTSAGDVTGITGGAVSTVSWYDKRGQALQTREASRQLSASVTKTLVHGKTYNAFGEVSTEIDPRGYDANGAFNTANNAYGHSYGVAATSYYSYNTMGRLLSKQGAMADTTAANGAITRDARATENYAYDLSGRLTRVTDANGNISKRVLLVGSGHDGSDPLVLKEIHADGGVVQTKYDVFGAARVKIDVLNNSETDDYDKNGNLITVTHPNTSAGTLVDHYGVDSLGQRTRHWNSQFGSGVVERTEFDTAGRIVKQTDYMGTSESYAFSWSTSAYANGLSASASNGGWIKTTTNKAGLTQTETSDFWGRQVGLTDYGNHTYTMVFDRGGRMTSQTITTPASGSTTNSYSWFSSGALYQETITGTTATFGYDAAGNRTAESYGNSQTATATYDLLNRMTLFQDSGVAGTQPVTVNYEYDLVGNTRRTKSTYRAADSAANTTLDFWYAYDSMNRFTVTRGQLRDSANNNTGDAARGSGTIERGLLGLDVTWNAASQRRTETQTSTPTTDMRSYYDYNADGTLALYGRASGATGTLSMTVPTGAYTESYTRDLLGRVTQSNTASTSTTTTYNMRSEVTRQDQVITQSYSYQISSTTYDYNLKVGSSYSGAYQGGVVTHTNSSGTLYPTFPGADPQQLETTDQATSYVWWRDAQQDRVTVQGSSTGTTYTQYSYDLAGRVASAYIADASSRTVTFTTDTEGKVIRRFEPAHGSAAAKIDLYYRIGGVERGVVSTTSQLRAIPGDTSTYYYGNFDQTFEPGPQSNTAPTYVVMQNDTLQSIAQKLWGDSNLWYKLATANGLTGSEALAVGQVLEVPQGVRTSRNAADTFKPYDPNTALGNNLPTDFAPPPPRGNGCGVLGQILLMAIAVAVTIATHGAFAKMAAAVFHLTTGAAAVVGGAITGVVSSLASQTVGVVTGLQSKFSWGAVAMAGIGGAVGGALSPNGAFGNTGLFGAEGAGGSFTKGVLGIAVRSDAIRAGLTSMVGNVATQGIEVATGLQHKFDWAGVAAAGAGGAIGNLVGGQLHATSLGDHLTLGNFGANLAAGAASAVAGAATRSVIAGTDFGDNIMASLPDAIGQTVGELFESAMARSGTHKATGHPINLLDQVKDGSYTGPNAGYDTYPGPYDALREWADTNGMTVEDASDFQVQGGNHSIHFSQDNSKGTGTTLGVILQARDDPALLLDMVNKFIDHDISIDDTVSDISNEITSLDPKDQADTLQNAYNILNSDVLLELSRHHDNNNLSRLVDEFNSQIARKDLIDGRIFSVSDIRNPENHAIYSLKQGDTLSSIANSLDGVTAGYLAKINGISNPDRIIAGSDLIIPTKKFVADELHREYLFVNFEAGGERADIPRSVLTYDPYGPPASTFGRFESMSALQNAVGTEYQRLVDIGYNRGAELWEKEELTGYNRNHAIGEYLDDFARRGMRSWFANEGLDTGMDGVAQIYVNQRLYDENGLKYRIPDLRVGNRYFDASLALKSDTTPQVRDFYRFGNPSMVTITRPTALGGAYNIPRPKGR